MCISMAPKTPGSYAIQVNGSRQNRMVGKVTGVDFGTTGIKLAQIKATKDSFTVEKQAFLPIDPKIISEGRIDPERAVHIVSQLKTLIEQEKFTKEAIMGVNSVNDVFVGRAITANHSPKEYATAIANDIAVDRGLLVGAKSEGFLFNPIVYGEINDPDTGETKLDVLLCGVAENLVTDQANILKKAGMVVVGCDIAAFAALRSIRTAQRDPGHQDVIVDIGKDVLSVLIHESGVPYYLSLQGDKAGQKATYLISDALDDDDMPANDLVKANLSSVSEAKALSAASEYNVVAERAINNAIRNYLNERQTSVPIAGITLIGGGALIRGLQEHLEEAFGIPVRNAEFDPAIQGEPIRYKADEPLSTDYAVAVGLGMGARV